MQISEVRFEGEQPPIDAYGPGGFRVAGDWLAGSLLLSPAGPVVLGGDDPVTEAEATLLEIREQIDVVVVGQGAEIRALPRALRTRLEEAGLGVEIMSTPSACRTYNVLLAEERRVAAVLVAL